MLEVVNFMQIFALLNMSTLFMSVSKKTFPAIWSHSQSMKSTFLVPVNDLGTILNARICKTWSFEGPDLQSHMPLKRNLHR